MREEIFEGILLSTLVIASIIALAIPLFSPIPVHAALTPHAPIYINGNSEFTSPDPVNGGGSGTENDPYILENYIIDTSTANGIEIRNTTAYFIIRNCYMHDRRDHGNSGVWFENVTNGRIDNMTSDNNSHGIFIGLSPNNIVLNCSVRNNEYGITLGGSNNNTIESCIVSNNQYGITAPGSNNIILNCAVENNEIGIFFVTLLVEDDDQLHKSTSNTVRNCAILNNTYGIRLLNDSRNNHIYYNNFENNNVGISLYYPAENNRIHHNNFINNPSQSFDNSSNYWDNGYPSGGNYWSDYTGVDADGDGIGDMSYNIPGNANQDCYPLMKPFGEIPSGGRNWPLIAGIFGVVVVISIVAIVYMRRR